MSDIPLRIRGIEHVVLRVRDMDRMIRFYGEVLGCPVDRRNEKLGLVHLRAGASLIDLVDIAGELGRKGGAAPGAEARNMDHVALRVEALDVAALRAHLARHGMSLEDPRDRYGADGEGQSVYIQDPEGNVVELKGPPKTPG